MKAIKKRMYEKTIGNFGNDLLKFINGELQESFPEISPVISRRSDGKIVILISGKGAFTEEKKNVIFGSITNKFFEIRKFMVGLDDKFNLGAALEKL